AEELLLDVDILALEIGVHRVAAAAEVHEVEQREVLGELLGREAEALGELAGGDRRGRVLAAAGEDVREQSLEDGEALGRDGAARPVEDDWLALHLDGRRG